MESISLLVILTASWIVTKAMAANKHNSTTRMFEFACSIELLSTLELLVLSGANERIFIPRLMNIGLFLAIEIHDNTHLYCHLCVAVRLAIIRYCMKRRAALRILWNTRRR